MMPTNTQLLPSPKFGLFFKGEGRTSNNTRVLGDKAWRNVKERWATGENVSKLVPLYKFQ